MSEFQYTLFVKGPFDASVLVFTSLNKHMKLLTYHCLRVQMCQTPTVSNLDFNRKARLVDYLPIKKAI